MIILTTRLSGQEIVVNEDHIVTIRQDTAAKSGSSVGLSDGEAFRFTQSPTEILLLISRVDYHLAAAEKRAEFNEQLNNAVTEFNSGMAKMSSVIKDRADV